MYKIVYTAYNLLRLLFLSLWTLGSILGTTLCTVSYTGGIKCTTNNVIAYTRKVLYTTSTNEDDRVFLQVVSFSRDVRVDLLRVCQTHTGNFTHCRIRLLRGCSVYTYTYATTLWTRIQSR